MLRRIYHFEPEIFEVRESNYRCQYLQWQLLTFGILSSKIPTRCIEMLKIEWIETNMMEKNITHAAQCSQWFKRDNGVTKWLYSPNKIIKERQWGHNGLNLYIPWIWKISCNIYIGKLDAMLPIHIGKQICRLYYCRFIIHYGNFLVIN